MHLCKTIFDLANPNAIYRSFNKRTTDKGKILDERLINLAEEFTLLLEKTKTPGLRHIRLKKHRSLPEETVEDFVLTNNGIE